MLILSIMEMAAILKMAAILNIFNWPHIQYFLVYEIQSVCKISSFLHKRDNSYVCVFARKQSTMWYIKW